MVKCKNCNEEILWVKSKKTGTNYPVNVGKTTKDPDYFHSKTCKSINKDKTEESLQEPKEEQKEITVGDILNNHEIRIRELEAVVSKMLEHFGRVYIEGWKK